VDLVGLKNLDSGKDRVAAILGSVVELPLAARCAWLAHRA
jgi:hypothetical protein